MLPETIELPVADDFWFGSLTSPCGEKHCLIGWRNVIFPRMSINERHDFDLAASNAILDVLKLPRLTYGYHDPVSINDRLSLQGRSWDAPKVDKAKARRRLAEIFEEACIKGLGYVIEPE